MHRQHYLQHLPCPHAVNSKIFLQVLFTSSIAVCELAGSSAGQTAFQPYCGFGATSCTASPASLGILQP